MHTGIQKYTKKRICILFTLRKPRMSCDVIESQGYLLLIEGKVNEQTVIIILEESFIS